MVSIRRTRVEIVWIVWLDMTITCVHSEESGWLLRSVTVIRVNDTGATTRLVVLR